MSESEAPLPDTHLEKAAGMKTTPGEGLPPPMPKTIEPPVPPLPLAPRSSLVTVVGVLSFVAAGLAIPVGVLLLVAAHSLERVFVPGWGPISTGQNTIVTLLRVFGVVELACSGTLIAGGVGVLLRKGWGLHLVRVVALLLLVSGLGQLIHPETVSVLGALLNVGFGAFALVVLLTPRFVAEFADRQSALAPARAPASDVRPTIAPSAVAGRALSWWLGLLLLVTHVLCVLVGFAVQPVVSEVRARRERDASNFFTQDGRLRLSGNKPFTVYYARPYATHPNLSVEAEGPLDPGRFSIEDQERNCFIVVPNTKPGESVGIRWTAKGLLPRD